jgi:hypothetical protein
MVVLYNCYIMHNNTHSVHKRLLKMWRARLLCLWPSRYIYPPPLSEANCPPFPSPGGPGPPASKMASFSPGSAHTPSLPSVTLPVCVSRGSISFRTGGVAFFGPLGLPLPRFNAAPMSTISSTPSENLTPDGAGHGSAVVGGSRSSCWISLSIFLRLLPRVTAPHSLYPSSQPPHCLSPLTLYYRFPHLDPRILVP